MFRKNKQKDKRNSSSNPGTPGEPGYDVFAKQIEKPTLDPKYLEEALRPGSPLTPDSKPLVRKDKKMSALQWLASRALVSFKIHEASNLINIEDGFKDSTRPFVRVTRNPIDDEDDEIDLFESKVWRLNTTPFWNQEFKFEVHGEASFTVEVFDKDDCLARENPMGSCTINWKNDFEGWVPLESVESGKIRVSIKKLE